MNANEPVAWARQDGVIAFHKKPEVDSQGFKWFPLYTHPVKELNDAIETLENLLNIADGGMQEGYKTMNSHFVMEEIKQAILEIRKAQEKWTQMNQ